MAGSTSRMLDKMGGVVTNPTSGEACDQDKLEAATIDAPRLTPGKTLGMDQRLEQIMKAGLSNMHTPMD